MEQKPHVGADLLVFAIDQGGQGLTRFIEQAMDSLLKDVNRRGHHRVSMSQVDGGSGFAEGHFRFA
jgi:hypothetical protein